MDQYKPPVTVIDPVMVATSGHRLLATEAEETLKTVLLPKASIVTPNIPEAEVLAGMKIESFTDMEESARRIAALGPQAVLVKGGHRVGDATDILYANQEFTYFKGEHLDSTSTHGTGCSLSSAIAADLANGLSLIDAVREAKRFVFEGIAHAQPIGKGHGPIHHFYGLYKKAGME